MTVNEHDRPQKTPRRALREWGGFVHLLARFYMNYLAAVVRASHRKRRRAVDIDTQPSKQGTLWCFHWATVGKNKLHDPKKEIHKTARIDLLTDAQIERLRGPKGQHPQRLITLLEYAAAHTVRVEVEVKTVVRQDVVERLLARPKIAKMHARGHLQFKTLAAMKGNGGAVRRLEVVHDAGGTTILSFTGFRGTISKSQAWPVTDYVRGRARWAA